MDRPWRPPGRLWLISWSSRAGLWVTLRDGVLTAVQAVQRGTPWPYVAFPTVLLSLPTLLAGATLVVLARAAGELSFRETHLGAAEWADEPFLRAKGLFDGVGLVLGRFGDPLKGPILRMPGETLSTMTISPPGTGKTVNLIGGILADHPEGARPPCPSMIINDPKGEIHAMTAGWRSSLGPVYHIRWTDLEGTCFNPLSLDNIPRGDEIVPRRRALIETLRAYYAEPARAISGLMVAARDFGDTWRDRVSRDPTLGFTMARGAPAAKGGPGGEKGDAREKEEGENGAEGGDAVEEGTKAAPERVPGLTLVADPDAVAAGIQQDRVLDRVSELAAIQTKVDAYVNRIVPVAVPSTSGDNSIWEVNGRAALSGFLLFSIFDSVYRKLLHDDPREASFGSMLTWLAGVGIDPDKSQEEMENEMEADEQGDDEIGGLLDAAITQARNRGYPARVAEELSSLKKKRGKERGSVISTALGKLNIFKSETIRARTSRSDITFADLRGVMDEAGVRRPVTIYFDVPLEDAEAVGIPTGFFMEGAAAYLISQSESAARTRPVVFSLDEFWTLPKMESIQQIPALGRGQWVQFNLIGQSPAQIALKLGKDAAQILFDAIAVKTYFTLNDMTTAEQVSKSIGNQTIEQENKSNTTGLLPSLKEFDTNKQRSFSAQPLMRPDALMSMPKLQPAKEVWGDMIVQVTGMMNRPIQATPVVWFKDPKLKARAALDDPAFVDGPKGVRMRQWRTVDDDQHAA